MAKRADLPNVPSSIDPTIRGWLTKAAEAIRNLNGSGDRSLRAVLPSEVAGLVGGGGGTTIITVPGDGSGDAYVPDLTPPPTPSYHGVVGTFSAGAGFVEIIVEWDAPTYTQGHGHAQANLYGAKWDGTSALPTFANAVPLDQFPGIGQVIGVHVSDPSVHWCLWLKWQSKDGVESTTPAGGINGVRVDTGQNVQLVLQSLSEQIGKSQLNAEVRKPIDRVGNIVNYRVDAKGFSASAPFGFRNEDGQSLVPVDSDFNVVVLDGTSAAATILSSNYYSSAYTSPHDPDSMVAALNALTNDKVLVVFTNDEPLRTATPAVIAALKRCGASGPVLTRLLGRSAYILVGIPGGGEGSGIERYAGAVVSDPNAWVTYNLQLLNGRPVGLGGNAAVVAATKQLADADGALASQITTVQASFSAKQGAALNLDPFCADATQWYMNASGATPVTISDGAAGTTAFRFIGPQEILSKKITVGAGRVLRASALARAVYHGKLFYCRIYCYTSADMQIGDGATTPDAGGLPTAAYQLTGDWSRVSGRLTTPAGTAYVRLNLLVNYLGDPDSNSEIQDARIEDETQLTASVQTEATARATVDGYLGSQYVVRAQISSGGRVLAGGYGISATSSASAGPTIDFGVVASRFWIGAPDGMGVSDIQPFVVQTYDTVINGVPVPRGVYMDSAFIVNLQAMIARLGNAWIDDAKIGSLSAAKLTAGDGTIGGNLKSANYNGAGLGWILTPAGYLEANNAVIRGTIYSAAGLIAGIVIDGGAIYSPNFVSGVSGFAINSNGSVELYNVTARGNITATSVTIQAVSDAVSGGATSGGRMTFVLGTQKVFDENNVKRIQIGNLTA